MDSICIENCEKEDMYDLMEHRLMQMTFWAHKEVLFEKIKQKIEQQEGEKLEKIAELLVEASRNRTKRAQEADAKTEEIKDKLREALDE